MNALKNANSAPIGVRSALYPDASGRADLTRQIRALLAEHGLLTSTELQRLTGKSQPTVSRALARLTPEIATIGKARSVRYALPRSILGWSGVQPIFLTDATGLATEWGRLYFLDGERVHVASQDGRFGIDATGDLPWFLAPLRPQGFLGRLRGISLGFAETNPERWLLEQVLYALIAHEHDHPGALSIGEQQGELLPEVPTDLTARAERYDQIAQNVNQTLPAGSSAGGEQPKFIAHLNAATGYERLIVKFTPPRSTPFGARWHDLLHTEHIALDVLRAHSIAAAESRIVTSQTRTYLESVRFDRIGPFGKRHVVPLSAVHRAWVGGTEQHWAATTDALARRGRLPLADAQQVRVLREFGRLLGNTDMHFGNLSLWVENMDDLRAPRFRLAPVYDMLCMHWRPGVFRDELGYPPFDTPLPSPGAGDVWPQAASMASAFWQATQDCPDVSAPIRAVAETQRQRLAQMIAVK